MPESFSSPPPSRFDIFPLGDRALLIEIAGEANEASVDLVHRIDARIIAARLPGIKECVPAFCSLAVHYDPHCVPSDDSLPPHALPFDVLRARIETLLAGVEAEAGSEGRLVEIPVCYGAEYGEDLITLALKRGMSADQFIAIHAAATYFVGMLGFLPGFPYLGGLDDRLVSPRRATPRREVPAGSVAIGGRHTGIYTFPSPGGWHLIGRTPLRLFQLQRDPPSLLAVGDRVRFVPISADAFLSHEHAGG